MCCLWGSSLQNIVSGFWLLVQDIPHSEDNKTGLDLLMVIWRRTGLCLESRTPRKLTSKLERIPYWIPLESGHCNESAQTWDILESLWCACPIATDGTYRCSFGDSRLKRRRIIIPLKGKQAESEETVQDECECVCSSWKSPKLVELEAFSFTDIICSRHQNFLIRSRKGLCLKS